jgi:hypothetical protein
MKRVQIQLTDDELRILRQQAQALGEPLAAIVRRAVDAWIDANERNARVERALSSIGGFRSGLGDLAEDHDRYLTEDNR